MAGNWSSWNWRLESATFLAMSGAIIASGNCALAQITPDSTLGSNERSLVRTNVEIKGLPGERIDGGAQRGTNLFHSFQEFNVSENQRVYFANPTGVGNILSRVTGHNPSDILGTLGVAGGSANLFLMNPNGIFFGPNASLDVNGSFMATTANAVQFGNQGSFSASAPNAASVLTVNPSALLFNQIAAQPVNSIENLASLSVPDGQSLLLVGGDITMNNGGLYAFGGRVELGGVTGAGTVGLNGGGNNLSLSFPDSVERSDVFLTNGAGVDVTASGSGSIAVNARNLEMRGASFLFAGIGSGLGSNNNQVGNIEVNATGAINLNNSSIGNQVGQGANGQGGDVNISTSTLLVKDGAQVSTAIFGAGDAGDLTVRASNVELIGTSADGKSAIGLSTATDGEGAGGDLTLNTNTLLVKDGAQVDAGTSGKGKGGDLTIDAQDVELIGTSADGQIASGLFASTQQDSTGDAGNLTLKTNTLLVKDGAKVIASTSGKGKGGDLTVNAQDVQLIGTARFPSGLDVFTQRDSTGDAGDLTLNTNTLLVKDGAQVGAGTFGKGKGGDLTVNAQGVKLIGTSADGQFRSGLFTQAEGAERDKGKLTIETRQLSIREGAQVSASTSGKGDAGDLTVRASESVELSGENSGLAAQGAEGDGGKLTIETGQLSIREGAQVSASTFGAGDAGDLTVHASNVELIGTSADGQIAGGLFAQAVGTGEGGDLTLDTGQLSIREGARVSAGTFGAGDAGDLTVHASNVELIGTSADGQIASGLFASTQQDSTGDAGNLTLKTNTLLVKDGAQVNTATLGKGKGGNLTVDAQDVQLIGTGADPRSPSGLFASAQSNTTGDAGDLTINTNTLLVQDGAGLAVQSLGTGTAGIMTLNAPSIRLDNNATVTANTQSTKIDPNSEQATIKINSQDLIMSGTSNITTDAKGTATGGNITIDTDLLVALENSDIRANAIKGPGGQVIINAQGIIGTEFRNQLTPESDITASSDLGPEFSGIVEINTPDVELQGSLNQLSVNFISPEQVVAGSCLSRRNGEQGSFVVTGTGGLPRSPYEAISGRYNVTGVQPIQGSSSVSQAAKVVEGTAWKKGDPIHEAQGMIVTADGRTIVGTTPQLMALAKTQNLVCYSD